ncbi:segregation and condensation protein A [Limosilactobacillus sp.]|jgi:segregation and condensation protein A|uniref:segregation and condensation protein A n=1 Tax=Limosilactobacillus sp. TaxID=2773925 RepID=UPI0025BC6F84|nr:segregation/condensation protein A [Limosilactobacillus sp.]MCH3922689.1 segregation/condensation protein A [Limosilactobacillus sp.]MCH3927372.1 segregation/condensation protein A [Limosilactobacillus sp.]
MNNEEPALKRAAQPTLKLGSFEGPLDLLLHLIREAKMDIYDIKIATITSQYMDYLHRMKAHRLEIAGEYFVMAATLMRIKSQLLLPQAPALEEESEEPPVDPRQELVDQLLEYQRYQKAADHLKDKEGIRQQEYTRPAMRVPAGLVTNKVAPGVTLDQLQAAFNQVLRRHRYNRPVVETVAAEKVSVAEEMTAVMKKVRTAPTRFVDLLDSAPTKDRLVTTFLAILELAKHQAIHIDQAGLFAPIILTEGIKSEEYRTNEHRPD